VIAARLGLVIGLAAVAAALAGAPACYHKFEPTCGFVCGPAGVCPDDYSCFADNHCHLDGTAADQLCGFDAAVDAPPDAVPDAPPDAPPDAHPDAPPDAHPDAPPDAHPDAALDAAIDAT
jgi:hypothetical protein